ncbi:LLM class flavin-dependent oxidoreductase [Pseudonocardia ailaonensis]|uniref:LLM class flavin-dependent oxidoreductase n=1 Tax=Pseudonocardia ailaonensis TaxID=367279 RepID=A0ABN2N684_9PSEU
MTDPGPARGAHEARGEPLRISVLDQSPVGTGQTAAEALRNTVDLARRADRLGFHRYWVAEHHGMVSHAISAPEVLVGAIAAQTERIRVGTGGVLLAHYSPLKVAESFRLLHALFPGRIDLGIGRSLAGGGPISAALDPGHALPDAGTLPAKLAELLAFLHDAVPAGHPFAGFEVTPQVDDAPPVWILGSSSSSAAEAGRAGIDYAFAHFINPAATRAAAQAYHAGGGGGELILGIGVYCGETETEAQRVYASQRLFRARLTQNIIAPVPSTEEALAELASGPDPLGQERFEWPRYVVGTPAQVRDQVTAIASAVGVREVVALATVHDHKNRVRSYELLAEAFGTASR